MSNEKFKVKFGLAVGDTAATVDGTTGNIVTSGNIAVNGGDITTTSTTANIVNTTATTLNIGGDATTTNIGKSLSGKVIIGNDLQITGNDILTGDGTTALTFTNVTGNVDVNGDLTVVGGDLKTSQGTSSLFNTTATTLNIGGAATTVSIGANTGTTTVNNDLVADSFSGAGGTFGNVTVGVATDQTISTTTGDLVLDSISGTITVNSNGTLGATLTPITGQWPNMVFAGNIVKGAIRNATTLANGDMWSLLNGTGTGYRGISIDNSAETTKSPAAVLRGYTGGASAPGGTTPRLLFERARGTSASPTAIQSGDLVGQITATGANGAGTFIGDSVAAAPGNLQFLAAEAWSGTTNVGTQMTVSLMPTGKTLASVATPTVVLGMTPQATTQRSDAFTWTNGNTVAVPNTNTKMALSSTNVLQLNATTGETTLQVGDVNIMQALSTWQSALAPGFKYTGLMSSSTLTGSGSYFEMSSRWKASSGTSTYDPPQNTWGLGRFGFSADNSTTGTSQINAGAIQSKATENWTSTATGSSLNFSANKAGSAGIAVEVLNMSPENTYVQSNQITFSDSNIVQLTGNKLVYNRVYGQWQYDDTLTPAAANTAYAVPFQGTNAVTDFANIATASNTSQIKPNALGMYKLQFSAQVQNSDNGADHTITFWWRKNGTNISNSAGYFTVPKAAVASGSLIVGWDNMVEVTTITDYFELVYAVDDTAVTIPFIAAAAPRPGAAAVFLTLIPVGA